MRGLPACLLALVMVGSWPASAMEFRAPDAAIVGELQRALASYRETHRRWPPDARVLQYHAIERGLPLDFSRFTGLSFSTPSPDTILVHYTTASPQVPEAYFTITMVDVAGR